MAGGGGGVDDILAVARPDQDAVRRAGAGPHHRTAASQRGDAAGAVGRILAGERGGGDVGIGRGDRRRGGHQRVRQLGCEDAEDPAPAGRAERAGEPAFADQRRLQSRLGQRGGQAVDHVDRLAALQDQPVESVIGGAGEIVRGARRLALALAGADQQLDRLALLVGGALQPLAVADHLLLDRVQLAQDLQLGLQALHHVLDAGGVGGAEAGGDQALQLLALLDRGGRHPVGDRDQLLLDRVSLAKDRQALALLRQQVLDRLALLVEVLRAGAGSREELATGFVFGGDLGLEPAIGGGLGVEGLQLLRRSVGAQRRLGALHGGDAETARHLDRVVGEVAADLRILKPGFGALAHAPDLGRGARHLVGQRPGAVRGAGDGGLHVEGGDCTGSALSIDNGPYELAHLWREFFQLTVGLDHPSAQRRVRVRLRLRTLRRGRALKRGVERFNFLADETRLLLDAAENRFLAEARCHLLVEEERSLAESVAP